MEFALELPFNSTSLGQCGINIAKEIFKLNLNPCIFPIGGVDLSTMKPNQDFNNWLATNINKAAKTHKRNIPTIKLWHLNGSLNSFSTKQILFSFYECDSPTDEELNIVRNNDKVVFCSNYTVNLFKDYGLNNVVYIPLGFDSDSFFRKDKQYFTDGRITFGLAGKLEPVRKAHGPVLKAWAAKYGNNPKYFLNCAIWNHFLKPGDQQNLLNQILEGKRYFNIQFIGWMPNNEIYNDFLNSNDIIIGMGCESWSLPEMQSVSIGKHSVLFNVNGIKDWATPENSVLVSPNGKIPCYDGIFFHKGQPYNQGNFFSFDSNDFLNKCDEAIERFNKSKINEEGLKLQGKYTWKITTEQLLSLI